jgi:hypothetical protein
MDTSGAAEAIAGGVWNPILAAVVDENFVKHVLQKS